MSRLKISNMTLSQTKLREIDKGYALLEKWCEQESKSIGYGITVFSNHDIYEDLDGYLVLDDNVECNDDYCYDTVEYEVTNQQKWECKVTKVWDYVKGVAL